MKKLNDLKVSPEDLMGTGSEPEKEGQGLGKGNVTRQFIETMIQSEIGIGVFKSR